MKIFICCLLVGTGSLVGCSEPLLPSQQIVQSYDLSNVKGLSDCAAVMWQPTNSSLSRVTVFRCPNSTVSASQMIGKQQAKAVTINEQTTVNQKRIDELEQQLNAIRLELHSLR